MLEATALHARAEASEGVEHPESLAAAVERVRLLRRGGRLELLDRIEPAALRLEGLGMPLGQQPESERASIALDRGRFEEAATRLARIVRESEDPAEDLDPDTDAAPAMLAQRGDWRRSLAIAHARPGRADAGFEALEEAKAHRLMTLMGDGRSQGGDRRRCDGGGVVELSQGQTLRERVRAVHDALPLARHPRDREALLAVLTQSRLELSALKDSLRQAYPLYGRISRLRVAGRQDARAVPEGAVLVSYVVQDGSPLGAFTLNSSGLLRWYELGAHTGLAQTTEALRLVTMRRGDRGLRDDAGHPVEVVRWREGALLRWRVVPVDAAVCRQAATAPNCRPEGAVLVGNPAFADGSSDGGATEHAKRAPTTAQWPPLDHARLEMDGAAGAFGTHRVTLIADQRP